MKNKTTNIISLALSIMLVCFTLFCLSTSFDISVNVGVIIVSSICFCSLYAVLSIFIKKASLFYLSTAVTGIVFVFTLLFTLNHILAQISYAISQVLSRYSKYMPVADKISLCSGKAYDATGFFVFVAVVLSAVITITLIRYRKFWITATLTSIMLVPCFILVNTLPSIVCIIGNVTILLALYVTTDMRKYNHGQSGAVTAIACIVMTVTLITVIIFNPIEGYVRFDWQDNLLEFAQSITGIKSNTQANSKGIIESMDASVTETDLSKISSIEQMHRVKMNAFSKNGGHLYLKGTSFADYSDNKWKLLTKSQISNIPQDFEAYSLTVSDLDTTGVIVRTKNIENVIFTSYYTGSISVPYSEYGDACVKNDTMINEYRLGIYDYNNSFCEIDITKDGIDDYISFVYDTYLQIPYDTKNEFLKIAQQNGIEYYNPHETAVEIKNFISKVGTYTLNAQQMPQGKDFPIWFVKEAHAGYCVHFASSATLMLRALGIPARYVTGYLINAKENDWTTVTSDNAHAWVEYFDNEVGWVPLECTPSSFRPVESDDMPSATTNNDNNQTTKPTEKPTEAPSSSQQTTVEGNGSSNKTSNKINIKLPSAFVTIMLVFAVIAAILVLIIIRRRIIIKNRKQQIENGENNLRAIFAYRYIMRIKRFSHIIIPYEIIRIAEKAKYSKNSISEKELCVIFDYIDSLISEFSDNLSPIKRLYYKYIKVLY